MQTIMKKELKRIVFDLCIAIPVLFFIYKIEGYTASKWEVLGIGFIIPILIRLIMWAKDGYKND